MTDKMVFEDKPVVPFERHWMCSECGAEMLFVRTTATGYVHECSGCYPQRRQEAKEKYPGIIHKQIES